MWCSLERGRQQKLGITCQRSMDLYTRFSVDRFVYVQHLGTLHRAIKRIVRDCNYKVSLQDHVELWVAHSCDPQGEDSGPISYNDPRSLVIF